MTDPKVKAAVDRGLPLRGPRMSEAEREEWGQEEPPRQTIALGMCGGVGRETVFNERYGEWCCPECGGPASVGCWAEDDPSYRAYHRALEAKRGVMPSQTDP